jgi:hypothetical protein
MMSRRVCSVLTKASQGAIVFISSDGESKDIEPPERISQLGEYFGRDFRIKKLIIATLKPFD